MLTRTLLTTFAVGLALTATAPRTADAAFIAEMKQVGANVVVNGSGTINLSGARPGNLIGFGEGPGSINPAQTRFSFGGDAGTQTVFFFDVTKPASFGSGGLAEADSRSGIGLSFIGLSLIIESTYVSGTQTSASMTFLNESLGDLGVTPGSYVWSWGSAEASTFETFTLNIIDPDAPIAVPAPGALGLFGIGLVGLIAARRRF